ncbi:MAG: hypothetical protein ACRC5H_00280 [Treponemataceae bacterium]
MKKLIIVMLIVGMAGFVSSRSINSGAYNLAGNEARHGGAFSMMQSEDGFSSGSMMNAVETYRFSGNAANHGMHMNGSTRSEMHQGMHGSDNRQMYNHSGNNTRHGRL